MAATPDQDGYHQLRVASVTRETADAVTITFDIPSVLASAFAYRAGQYLTLRIGIDGKRLTRSYSMSSAPGVDGDLRITVKRIAEGRVSRWANETLKAGDWIEVMPPAGRFCLRDHDGPVVLLGAGSGITPLISLAKAALATTSRPVALLYANRDRAATIFADALDDLAAAHADRFTLSHWFDAERGLIGGDGVAPMLRDGADYYVCGPDAFMDMAESVVLASGADREHVFIERFVSPPDDPDDAPEPAADLTTRSAVCETLTVTLRGVEHQIPYTPGDTIIQAAFDANVRPPISCLSGSCATCMAKLTVGSVEMLANDVLTPKEIAAGYVLTCQGIPTAKHVAVTY